MRNDYILELNICNEQINRNTSKTFIGAVMYRDRLVRLKFDDNCLGKEIPDQSQIKIARSLKDCPVVVRGYVKGQKVSDKYPSLCLEETEPVLERDRSSLEIILREKGFTRPISFTDEKSKQVL